jgi:HK97 family phage portal protein
MIFDRLFEPLGTSGLSTTSNPAQWFIEWATGGGKTAAGVSVDQKSAMTYSAVWAATRILTDAIATVPCVTFRRRSSQGGKGKDKARDHRLFQLLHDEPNGEMDSCTFWGQQGPYLINAGDSYAEIERSMSGAILALWPLQYGDVKPHRREDGQIEHEVTRGKNGSTDTVSDRDMFHVAGTLSEDGITGRGVIRQARESIGMGLATERFGAGFFGNGCRPGGVLMTDHTVSPAAYTRLGNWKDKHGGVANSHKLAILEEGLKYAPLGINPEDAQFLGTRQHNITEIARWYGLPPHVLADLMRATFSNIEEMELHLLIHSFRPWWVRIEKAMHRQLLAEEEKPTLFMAFNGNAFLRGDSKSRTEAHKNMFGIGGRTLNEIAGLEDENEIGPAGDRRFIPMNMIPLDRVDDYVDAMMKKAGGTPQQGGGEQNSIDVDSFTGSVVAGVVPPIVAAVKAGTQEICDTTKQCKEEVQERQTEDREASRKEHAAMARQEDAATSRMTQSVDTLSGYVRPTAAFAAQLGEEYRERACADAMASILVSYLHMLSVEINEVRRAAKTPKAFLSRLEVFWDRHQTSLRDRLRAPVAAWVSAANAPLNANWVVDEVVQAHFADSRKQLLSACECKPDELVDRVAACVADWDKRRPCLPDPE